MMEMQQTSDFSCRAASEGEVDDLSTTVVESVTKLVRVEIPHDERRSKLEIET